MRYKILAALGSMISLLIIACKTNQEWLVWVSIGVFGVIIIDEWKHCPKGVKK